jgi:hypothetical protein
MVLFGRIDLEENRANRAETSFMSEIQLQGLLDRTKPSQGDEEAMDMTTIDGICVSKYSIKAIRVR